MTVVRLALKRCAAATDRMTPRRRGVVVLLYHRVGAGSGLAVDLPPREFDDQMAALAGRVVALDDAIELLAAPAAPAGPDPVVVTFDDGTADFADEALPVLARHRIPATLYVATRFVDRGESFPRNGTPLSWSALADCCATGLVTIGSHTHTHALLDRTPLAEAVADLDRSIETIRERLGHDPAHFAYPKAVPPAPPVEREVRRRFRSAALAGTRPNLYGRTDPHRLARSPIQVGDERRYFDHKVAGGMWLEDAARRVANRLRYRGATA